MKYETPKLSIVYFVSDDVITSSGAETEWKDENVRPAGWL